MSCCTQSVNPSRKSTVYELNFVPLAECGYAEASYVHDVDMVVEDRLQFYILGAVTTGQEIICDEDIPVALAHQRRDDLLDYGRIREQCKPVPMDGAEIHEVVECILLTGVVFGATLSC